MKKLRFLCLTLYLLITQAVWADAWTPDPPALNVGAAILVESSSGVVLYEKNADHIMYPASLTKIMTCLLALEHGNLEDVITASAQAVTEGLHEAGSTQNILAGEEMTLRQLLDCVMVASANEACNIVAEYVAGSIPAFLEMMNDRAQELGCEKTSFVNTHGLHDENHYTTAADMYRITLEAMKHPAFLEICYTESVTIPPTNKTEKSRTFHTTNNLISRLTMPDYYFPAAKGIKTGHTTPAGYCLVSSAEKDSLQFVSVVMKAVKDEQTGRIGSFDETRTLLEYGMENFAKKTVITPSDVITEVPVLLGKDTDAVTLIPDGKLETVMPKEFSPGDVTRVVTVYQNEGVTAPIRKGQVMGEIELSLGERDLGVLKLVAATSVDRSEAEYMTQEARNFVSQDWFMYGVIGIASVIGLYLVITITYNMHRKRQRARGNYRGRRRRRR